MDAIDVLNAVAPSTVRNILTECFSGHPMEKEDIDYAVSVFSNISINPSNLAKIVSYICKCTTTGRLALSLHEDIMDMVRARDSNGLVSIIGDDYKTLYPELYDNPRLSKKEIEMMERIGLIEYKSVLKGIQVIQEKALDGDYCTLFGPICEKGEVMYSHTDSEDKDGMTKSEEESIFSICHGNVCISSNVIAGVNKSSVVYVPTETTDDRTTRDKLGYTLQQTSTINCFDLIGLLDMLHQSPYINPITGKELSEGVAGALLKKYKTEIKMYQRFVETRDRD